MVVSWWIVAFLPSVNSNKSAKSSTQSSVKCALKFSLCEQVYPYNTCNLLLV